MNDTRNGITNELDSITMMKLLIMLRYITGRRSQTNDSITVMKIWKVPHIKEIK